jgi:hypothetical protein
MTTVITKTTSSGGKVKITTATATNPNALGSKADPLAALIASVSPATTIEIIDPLAEARAAFAAGLAEVEKTSDRWTSNYAAAMNENMPLEWWTFAHNDKSPSGLRVRREQKAAYAALKTVGYSNPSVAWKRVRTAAAKLAGWVDAETEEKAEDGEAKAKASPYIKIQELIADAIKKLSNLEADHSAEMQLLGDVAKRLPSL